MKVSFFAYLRDPDFAGCKTAEITGAGDVRELGNILSSKYGSRFRAEFFSPDGEQLGERMIVLVNGRRVEFLDGIATRLTDSDSVQIFPVVAGG